MAAHQRSRLGWVDDLPGGRRAAVACLAAATCLLGALPFVLTARPAVSAPPASAAPASPAAAPPVTGPLGSGGTHRGSGAGPGTPSGDSQVVFLDIDGTRRGYLLLPALGVEPGEPSPLLVVLHHDVASAREVADSLGLDVLRRQGVTLAYPAGVGGSWNSGECCGIAKAKDVDDVAFLNAVLDDVGKHTPVDPERRGLLGYSGGGQLVYRLMCGPHEPLVAVVEVNGSLEVPCGDDLVLPDMLSVHGERDGTVGLRTSVFVNHLGMAPRSVTDTLSTITQRAGCGLRQARREDDVDRVHWSGCRGGSTFEAKIVLGAGHGWDDVGGAERTIDFLLSRLVPPTRAD